MRKKEREKKIAQRLKKYGFKVTNRYFLKRKY